MADGSSSFWDSVQEGLQPAIAQPPEARSAAPATTTVTTLPVKPGDTTTLGTVTTLPEKSDMPNINAVLSGQTATVPPPTNGTVTTLPEKPAESLTAQIFSTATQVPQKAVAAATVVDTGAREIKGVAAISQLFASNPAMKASLSALMSAGAQMATLGVKTDGKNVSADGGAALPKETDTIAQAKQEETTKLTGSQTASV